MPRSRLIPLGLLAAFALSAVVLTPALAEPKKCGVPSPTHWAFCYGNGEEMSNPVQKVSGTGGTSILAATMGAAEAEFECKENTFAGELEASGKGGGTLTLLKCKETKPAHCRLTAAEEKEIKFHLIEALIGKLEKGKAEAQFTGAGAGEEVIKLTLEHENSECPIPSGGYKVTGKQYVELPKAEESLTEHEIVAEKSGSYFKVGENEASLSSTAKVKLLSPHEGSSWYVGLGT